LSIALYLIVWYAVNMRSEELDKLERELPKVSRQSRLYKIVEKSVKEWGNWKAKPRGKPRKGYWQKKT
jgi:hypothetical protein